MARLVNFQTRLLLAFLAAVGVVMALTLESWRLAQSVDAAALRATHAHSVLADLAQARVASVHVKLSTQSFGVSGDPARLAERNAAIAAREQWLARLKAQTAGNPVQQAHWQHLREVIDQRLAISRQIEHLRNTQGYEAATAYTESTPVAQARARSLTLFDSMEAEVRRQLQLHEAEQLAVRSRLLPLGALACATVLLLLSASFWLVRRKYRETEASRQAPWPKARSAARPR